MQNLARRGCEVNNICCQCGIKREHALHIFRDCWWSREVLQDLHLPQVVLENQCQDPGYWLWLCAKQCKEDQFGTLLMALWLVWRNRNEIIHGKEGKRIEEVKIRLSSLVKEVRYGKEDLFWWNVQQVANGQQDTVIMCDGSFDETTKNAGAGAILIEEGRVQEVRARFFDKACSMLQAECQAILLGLQLARESNRQKVKLFTDSREALWAIIAGSWKPEAFVKELKDCIGVLDEHRGWRLGGIDRAANSQADWLARKARGEGWEWKNSTAIPFGLPKL
ncbi:hypothetical protein QQ045_012052 [Rhodiola kirilowii]